MFMGRVLNKVALVFFAWALQDFAFGFPTLIVESISVESSLNPNPYLKDPGT